MEVQREITSSSEVPVPDELLIGFSGKVAIKRHAQSSALENRAGLLSFIPKFRSKHSLDTRGVGQMLSLFRMGGMSNEKIHRLILQALMESAKRSINSLTQVQLSELLEESHSYLTVPELRPIPIMALERLENVGTSIWHGIVDNGLAESPYIDLPLTLQRRIWAAVPHIFTFELCAVIDVLPEHAGDFTLEGELRAAPDRSQARSRNKALQRLLQLTGSSDDLLVLAVDRLVEAGARASPGRRRTIADILHDMLCATAPRRMPNLERLRAMAVRLDVERAVPAGDARAIHEALADRAACGPVALLVSSCAARRLAVRQLIAELVARARALPDRTSAQAFAARRDELLREPLLGDLAWMCVAGVRAGELLAAGEPLAEQDVHRHYDHFFPILTHEIAADRRCAADHFHAENAREAHPELARAAGKDPFERAVLVQYALRLLQESNAVALARLRLVLDFTVQRVDAAEEQREAAIAHELIVQMMYS